MPEQSPTELFVYSEGGWSSLWLKAVRTVDLTQHCIESFTGERIDVDRKAGFQRVDLTEHMPAPAFYLCGVSYPYVWENNAHALLLPAPGEEHDVIDQPGLDLVLVGLRAVPEALGDEFIDWSHPKSGQRLFHTCRNWRAAHFLRAELGLVDEVNPERKKFYGRKTRKAQAPLF
jgi:hypothetical protein